MRSSVLVTRLFKEKPRSSQSFQRKGSTVLMVSHALDTMIGMCDRIAWIDHGKTQKIGEPQEVIAAYRGQNL